MSGANIAFNSPQIDALLAILIDCASRNVQRPPTGDIAEVGQRASRAHLCAEILLGLRWMRATLMSPAEG